ncbi:MAG: tRNA (adenosine(37)-N6)-threonylcarbamoyltransferase complex ATPase subunit type 1 TsaE [Caldisericia bacterium]|nr:tRNA (adenosine(37)-N6)-threonylcarbamoyltransferase complex ATPase subunit type 1 TsaE [Caldisericia bacterium]
MESTVSSQEELISLGRWFGEGLTGNEIIALEGILGAGKTTFVKGIAAAIGISEIIISPSFVLLREYESGKFPLFHFDWYRIDTSQEVEKIGYWDYIEMDGIKIIEWPNKFPNLVPDDAKWIKIEMLEDGRKLIW